MVTVRITPAVKVQRLDFRMILSSLFLRHFGHQEQQRSRSWQGDPINEMDKETTPYL